MGTMLLYWGKTAWA